MSTFEIVANLFSYACFNLGALLVWPSRRNVVAWLGLPFFIIAYLIPLLVVDYTEVASRSVIASLTLMNLVGAVAMVFGLVIGSRLRLPPLRTLRWRRRPAAASSASPSRATFRMLTLGCVIMTLCFAWMGFLPVFADDPFLAKFFRGQYKEKFDQVSVFYRFSQTMVMTALPLAMAMFITLRERKLLIPICWAVALFALSLNRGTVVAGLVLLWAAWSSRSVLRMSTFLLISTIVYSVGSSVYVLLGIIVSDDFNIWAEIARGAPDIKDHLTFLQAFNPERDLSYGLTFIGGLVPGNFSYNPSVYTLAIANGTSDVSEIASGGFRLPPSVAGYMALSWSGVLLVSLGTGLLTGYFVTRLRSMPRTNISQQVATLIWFQVIAEFWINFDTLSYQGLIAVFLFTYLVPDVRALGSFGQGVAPSRRPWRLRFRRRARPTQMATAISESR